MKLKICSKSGARGEKALPPQFREEVRPDIIKRAVLAEQSAQRQKYGSNPVAGKRASAELSRRRRNYRGSYGHGISRVPRKILSRRGTRMHWVGAFAPGTVGGRRAHHPKAEKNWEQKVNRKEWKKAVRSAISATVANEIVQARGHNVPKHYPFLIDSSSESLDKTSDAKKLLEIVGISEDLERSGKRKVRAGKGKRRGRKYKLTKGPLLVVSGKCPLVKSGRNIPGVDVVEVNELQVSHLAPGCHEGRLTLFTEKAIEKMEKEKLFL